MSLSVSASSVPVHYSLSPTEIRGQVFLDAAYAPEFHQMATERFLAKTLFFLDQNPFVTTEQLNKMAAEAVDETRHFFDTMPELDESPAAAAPAAPAAAPAAPATPAAPAAPEVPTKKSHRSQFHSQSFQMASTCHIYHETDNRTVAERIRDAQQKNSFYIRVTTQLDPPVDGLIKPFAIRIDRTAQQSYTLIDIEKGAPRFFQTDSLDEAVARIDAWSPDDRHLEVHYLNGLSHGAITR